MFSLRVTAPTLSIILGPHPLDVMPNHSSLEASRFDLGTYIVALTTEIAIPNWGTLCVINPWQISAQFEIYI